MYISEIPTYTKSGKLSHTAVLLRRSYREKGKPKTETIANLTHANPQEVDLIKWALKNKNEIEKLKSIKNSTFQIKESKSIGAVYAINTIIKRLGIDKALGNGLESKLARFQIIARIIDQGSRLSAIRLAGYHGICEVLEIKESITEDNLYKNLAWLTEHQKRIEENLFKSRYKENAPEIFLYDVTSSYFEGQHNELAKYGYNRDNKRGKLQLVAGLLCDGEGNPISIKLFEGNTLDYHTLKEEIKQVSEELGCKQITLVGDRGMIKSEQIEMLEAEDFYYITAITKPQVEKLINDGVIQISIFDEELKEIEHEGIRYILRRNPMRAEEIQRTRESKKAAIEKLILKKTEYLKEHPKAKVETAEKAIQLRIRQLKAFKWLKVTAEGRTFKIEEDKEKLLEESQLDGCYVIKSNVGKAVSKETIHSRYKDLSKVEKGFRCSKTELLELRPWFVRLEGSTRGHALIVMLSYMVVRYLTELWKEFDLTFEEGIKQLSTLSLTEVTLGEKKIIHNIPEPRDMTKKLLKAANIKLPEMLPFFKVNVRSRVKLKRKT